MCLHGLTAAPGFEGRADLLVRLAEEALAEFPDHHLFHARAAAGHFLAGRWDTALEAIDKATAALPANGSRTSHALFQTQYLVQRQDIIAARSHQAMATTQPAHTAVPSADADDSGSLVRYELLMVTVALTVWALASLPFVASGQLATGEWAILGAEFAAFLGLLLVGVVLISTTVRKQTRSESTPPCTRQCCQ